METQDKVVPYEGDLHIGRFRVIKGGHVFREHEEGLYIDSEGGHMWLVRMDPTMPTVDDTNVAKLRPCVEHPGTFDVAVDSPTGSYTNVTRKEALWLIQRGWAKIVPRTVKYRPPLRWHKVGDYTCVAELRNGYGVIVQTEVGLVFIPDATLDDIAPEAEIEVTGMEEE